MIDANTRNAAIGVITNSSLGVDDRNLWLQKINNATNLQGALFVSLCSTDASLLETMTLNLKDKISALKSGKSFSEIFSKEEAMLRSALTQ